MASLPVIQQQTEARVGIPGMRAATATDFGANTGLQQAGAALDNAATSINRAMEIEDSAAASRAVAETRARWAVKLHEDMKYAESQLFAPTPTEGKQSVPPGAGGPTDMAADAVGVKGQPITQLSYRDFSTKFVNDLNDDILKQRGQMRTKQGSIIYDNMMANLRSDFTVRAFEAQADLAGKKAVADFTATVDSNANTLMADPTHFQAVLKETNEQLAAMTNIPAGMRDKLFKETKETLAMAAGRGLIDANPMVALQEFRSGKYNELVSPEKLKQLQGESITEMKALEVMAEKLRKQAQQQLAAQREATNNDFLEKYAEGKLVWNDVKGSNLEAMGEGSKNFWLGMLDKQAREGVRPVKTDAALYWDLTKRINLPPGDPKKIVDQNQLLAYHDRISISDLRDLRNQAVQARGEDGGKLNTDTNRFLESMRAQFIKEANGIPDPQGEEAFYKFNFALREEMEKYREANKDPRELMNPNSPAYFGKQVKLFSPSQTERIKRMSESIKEEYRTQKGEVDPSTIPPVPSDPAQREIGGVYRGPTGVGTWTEKGWMRGLWRYDAAKKTWVPQ